MTTSKRVAERRIEKFEKNITKRGAVKKASDFPYGPIILGLFAFVIVGSYIYQMIRTAIAAGGEDA